MREYGSFEKPRLRLFEISNLIKIGELFLNVKYCKILVKILQQDDIESAGTEEDE